MKHKTVLVAAAALRQFPLAWEQNLKNIKEAILLARKDGVSLLCLPELCITGYDCGDLFLAPYVIKQAEQCLVELLEYTQDIAVTLNLPVAYDGKVYNAVCMVVNKQLCGLVFKQNLANDGIHYESRWFSAWERGKTVTLTLANVMILAGDLLFNFNGIKVGVEICHDAWVKDRVAFNLIKHQVNIILNPSASHFALGKVEIRKKLIQDVALRFNLGYIFANQVGNLGGNIIYDGDLFIANGAQLTQGERFSFKDVTVFSAPIDIGALNKQTKQQLTDISSMAEVEVDFVLQGIDTQCVKAVNTRQQDASSQKQDLVVQYEEFTRAVSIGLFDYLVKSKAQGYAISLSGGIDSAACAVLVYIMLHLAVKELGVAGVQVKLSQINLELSNNLDAKQAVQQISNKILWCLNQPSQYSSKATQAAAKAVANGLNAQYFVTPIDPLVNEYLEIAKIAFGRELNAEQDSLALQNIQARVRAPNIWLLANINNAIVLATGNRSEAAVGYLTMDGDSCGGLSPIGGIDKAFIIAWMQWLEKVGFSELGKMSYLHFVNQNQPSAELKSQQTDEAELMPYGLLYKIERLAVYKKMSPLEVMQELQASGDMKIEHKDLIKYIGMFYTKFAQNQWKRERLAPAFHVSDFSLDPKSCSRLPILADNFTAELVKLSAYKVD